MLSSNILNSRPTEWQRFRRKMMANYMKYDQETNGCTGIDDVLYYIIERDTDQVGKFYLLNILCTPECCRINSATRISVNIITLRCLSVCLLVYTENLLSSCALQSTSCRKRDRITEACIDWKTPHLHVKA
jgi:hypothetical protein